MKTYTVRYHDGDSSQVGDVVADSYRVDDRGYLTLSKGAEVVATFAPGWAFVAEADSGSEA